SSTAPCGADSSRSARIPRSGTASGLQDGEVPVSGEVRAPEEVVRVRLAAFGDAVGGQLPVPTRVEAAQTLLEFVEGVVVDVVVQPQHLRIAFTGDLESRTGGEGHVEEGVEGLAV